MAVTMDQCTVMETVREACVDDVKSTKIKEK